MEVIGRAVLSGSESDRQITAALMTLSQEWRGRWPGTQPHTTSRLLRRRRGVFAHRRSPR